jgi:uncharacterized protein YwgA
MSDSDRTKVLLCVLQSLKTAGSWCGETHVQKALFLCQNVAHVPSDFKYVLYKHGPYSFELSEHLQQLIADNLVCVRARPPYGPSLELNDEAKSIVEKARSRQNLMKGIDFISRKVGTKNVAELERLATAVYLREKYRDQSSTEAMTKVLTSVKPHVPVQSAREAFTEADAIRSEAAQALS